MNAILAAVIVLASLPAAPIPDGPAPSARPSDLQVVTPATSPLPGAPLDVRLTRTSAGTVLTWRPPTRSGDSPIVGYVVVAADAAHYVDGGTTRMVVSEGSDVAVASVNGSGCSVASKARVIADRAASAASLRASR